MTTTEGPLRVVSADSVVETTAAPSPAPRRPREPVKIELQVPIRAHNETIHTLTLRVPTPDDFESCGELPMEYRAEGPRPSVRAVNGLIVRLGEIPRSSVSQLDPYDYIRIVNEIIGFLAPPDRTS
jgi:Phage tail assembly chaperone proteins, E, or 41 or 14